VGRDEPPPRITFAATSISGPLRARPGAFISLRSLLALDTKLPGVAVSLIDERIVQLPKEEFLPLLHEIYREQYELHRDQADKPPSAFPRVIEDQARRVEPAG